MGKKEAKGAKKSSKAAELLKLAKEARKLAYAPYSNFKVGAALRAGGRTYTGANVENASYGLTVCAERVAVLKAVSEGSTELENLVVVTEGEEPRPPCGACLQVLSEWALDLPVVMVTVDGKKKESTVKELLPRAFRTATSVEN